MSLDAYLQRVFDLANVKGTVEITSDGTSVPVDVSKISNIVEEIGQWHRAHAIHNWFVENLEMGNSRPGSKWVDTNVWWLVLSDLIPLLDKCKQVMETVDIPHIPGYCGTVIQNPDEMKAILPIPEQFHGRGGSEYDYWYVWHVENTIKYLEDAFAYESVLNEKGFFPDYYYVIS